MFEKWKSSSKAAIISLLVITAIWGGTFIIVKQAIAQMPVMDFLALRFLLAAAVMFLLRPRSLRSLDGQGIRRGVFLGILLGLSYVTQTYGLVYASATVVGFVTGMFVVFTPFIAWVWLHQKITGNTWLAVGLAVVGLAFLSLNGWTIGTGELLTLSCAVCLALYTVGLGKWSSQHETYSFTFVQLATIAIILFLITIPGGITIPTDAGIWLTIGVTAIFATALAFFVQTWAQSILSPTHAAVILTMEPLFAGVFAVLIGNEPLTLRIVLGAIFILSAMYIVQLKTSSRREQI
jgi:drug/metabolite transporter (DMT)-like permease